MAQLRLKPNREKPILQNHPWVFSGAVESIVGDPEDGDIVNVLDNTGNFLAKGYINRKSQIIIRVLTRNFDEKIDRSFFEGRLTKAIEYRKAILKLTNYDAFRLIHDTGDMLPGLIIDKYGDFVVAQFLTLGMDKRKREIIELIDKLLAPRSIYERSDSNVREKEGLMPSSGLLRGDQVPDLVEVNQNGLKLAVDIKDGQKTGAYLDQRENLEIVASYSKGRDVLDCFCYTGAFSVSCALNGAKNTLGVDISEKSLDIAGHNARINGVAKNCQFLKEDVFKFLNECDRKFDMIILDPPGFAKSDKDITKASRAYKHINMCAMKILNPGGILATFSCSYHIDLTLFRKIVFSASVDANCNLRIMHILHAATDHPINIACPESEYLKGFICQKI